MNHWDSSSGDQNVCIKYDRNLSNKYQVSLFWIKLARQIRPLLPNRANEIFLEYPNVRLKTKSRTSKVVLKIVTRSVITYRICCCTWMKNFLGVKTRQRPLSAVLPLFEKIKLFHLEQNKFNWNVTFGCKARCRNVTALHVRSGRYSHPPSFTGHDLWVQRSPPPRLLNASSLFSKLYIVLHPSNLQNLLLSLSPGLSLLFWKRFSYNPPARRAASRGGEKITWNCNGPSGEIRLLEQSLDMAK